MAAIRHPPSASKFWSAYPEIPARAAATRTLITFRLGGHNASILRSLERSKTFLTALMN